MVIDPVQNELLARLRCPVTRQTLHLAEPELIDWLNDRIDEGVVRNRGGDVVEQTLDDGLVNEEGSWLHGVRGDIVCLLADEAIALNGWKNL